MMLEVLVARSAPGFMRGSSRAYSSCLAARFSKMASITRSAAATPSPATSAQSPARRCALRRVAQALVEELLGTFQRRLDVLGGAIFERHREAAQRRPGGDIPAHDTGADDVHVTDVGACLAARTLERILQQEDAHEIARGVGGEQVR